MGCFFAKKDSLRIPLAPPTALQSDARRLDQLIEKVEREYEETLRGLHSLKNKNEIHGSQ